MDVAEIADVLERGLGAAAIDAAKATHVLFNAAQMPGLEDVDRLGSVLLPLVERFPDVVIAAGFLGQAVACLDGRYEYKLSGRTGRGDTKAWRKLWANKEGGRLHSVWSKARSNWRSSPNDSRSAVLQNIKTLFRSKPPTPAKWPALPDLEGASLGSDVSISSDPPEELLPPTPPRAAPRTLAPHISIASSIDEGGQKRKRITRKSTDEMLGALSPESKARKLVEVASKSRKPPMAAEFAEQRAAKREAMKKPSKASAAAMAKPLGRKVAITEMNHDKWMEDNKAVFDDLPRACWPQSPSHGMWSYTITDPDTQACCEVLLRCHAFMLKRCADGDDSVYNTRISWKHGKAEAWAMVQEKLGGFVDS